MPYTERQFDYIGITGAAGHIGTVLRRELSDSYNIKSFTLEPAPFPSTVVDFSKAEQVKGCFRGLEAVIHLAADPRATSPWDSVYKNNIEATYQVFEECKRAGVKRLIFASTNHVQNGNTRLTGPDTLLFGEHLGKLYSEQHGLEFVGLRIGAIFPKDDPTILIGTEMEDYIRAIFLSWRDLVQAFKKALEVKTRFLLAYAVSRNDRRVFDLEETEKSLRFKPLDNAEDYF